VGRATTPPAGRCPSLSPQACAYIRERGRQRCRCATTPTTLLLLQSGRERYPRLESRGGGKQQAVGLAGPSCLLASFRSILAQIPRRFLGVHHLGCAILIESCRCPIILSLFWSVCCGRRRAICSDSKRYYRLLPICLSPISLPLFCICFSFGPFPVQPLLI
jgi:hypothetical protein